LRNKKKNLKRDCPAGQNNFYTPLLLEAVDEIGKTIVVLRFFYGARDYAKLI